MIFAQVLSSFTIVLVILFASGLFGLAIGLGLKASCLLLPKGGNQYKEKGTSRR